MSEEEKKAKKPKKEKQPVSFTRHLIRAFNVIIVVMALAVIVSYTIMPVIRVTGDTMKPTLATGEIVLCFKTMDVETGKLCAFYRNNKILIRRVIARGGDIVNMDEDGHVIINGEQLDEPYAYGLIDITDVDIDFPYRVPDDACFVLADNRNDAADSRFTSFGNVLLEDVLGQVFFRVYPLNTISWSGL